MTDVLVVFGGSVVMVVVVTADEFAAVPSRFAASADTVTPTAPPITAPITAIIIKMIIIIPSLRR